MSGTVLAATDLRVRRGSSDVIAGLSLTVRDGETVLIQGKSGSGKSTLFEVFGLLSDCSSGELHIDGVDVRDLSRRERALFRRDRLGMVYQDFQLVPDLTARENARLPQSHGGGHDPAWLETIFERLEIGGIGDQYPATLSGGEKQRVAIARAVANKPGIVIADEPTGQLDPETTDRVIALLFEAQELAGTTLLTVSHDRRITSRFERVYRLAEGTLHRLETGEEKPGLE
ncbi:ABC transporter ATP-binding protein [Halorhabdus sp. BNX81]|uniref:ABC transporter ATP-binding protein n=1 Tax=Halorhabdus sp. BNX81 TaxID=2980181 RepID=UPI0023DD23EC|nr:ABC transporter ATP-binding protein [Halorhabdus sp. BNX81]WEL20581.1 ABC-type antimicrobial peptide transport system,ATPase component [Halorhabdus sp. BNX81]